MKKILLFLLCVVLLAYSAFNFISCKGNDSLSNPDDIAPIQSDEIPSAPQSGDSITLSVYNWGEYLSVGKGSSADVNELFEEYYYNKYGVKVDVLYSTYSTNEDMYSKIKSNAGSYDVIFPSDYMIERMIDEDLLLPFDANTISNFKYISDSFKGEQCIYDPGNLYSVPYTYGMVGVIYNINEVDKEDIEDKSWELLWNEKYRGKILQFNNPRDAFGTAMYYEGIDVNTNKKSEWDKAADMLKEQKPLLQAYVSDEIFNKMTDQSAFIAPYFAGDFITMYYDVEEGVEKGIFEKNFLDFYYPSEGTNYFVDAMCIPKNSKNVAVAKEYINFMLSEEIAVANAITVGYASPNILVKENADYKDEMGEFAIDILYNTDLSKATMYRNLNKVNIITDEGEINAQAYLNSSWEDVKTWIAVELWVHVVSIAIIVGVIGFCAYSFYIKKKRSRFYRYRDRKSKAKKH